MPVPGASNRTEALLAANNEILETMADIEGAIAAGGSDHMQKLGSLRSINPYDPFLAIWTAVTRRARQYAYHFFFEYPRPFPWHLLHFWNELESWPIARVLSAEGLAQFGRTFDDLFEVPAHGI